MEEHVYKTRFGLTVFCLVGGTLVALLGVCAMVVPLFAVFKQPIPVAFLGLALFLMGGFVIRGVLTYRVTLTSDYVEVNNGLPFGTKRMLRKDIAARQYDRSYLVLYSESRKQWPLSVGMTVQQDDYFRQWMAAIPLVDKEFFKQRRNK